ncbi:MAG: GAF domain-containing protein [Chloroflexi bacterium]|nr:GAF domain-containing protein [Chloroflexota bacterium]
MGKQFRLDDNGLVPGAAATRHPALSNHVRVDPHHFANPLLPETRSELAIPMLYRGMLIGVLDMQSEKQDRFGEEDIRILRTLADQIAVAVRNSMLFEETRAAKELAEQADKVKSAFLASMSHELRTPLNAIINFSKFLKKGIPGPINPEQSELVSSIADSGQHLLNLINDVLDMSKIEAGSLRLFVETGIDLREVAHAAVQLVRPLVADKPVELRMDFPRTCRR